MTGLRIAPLAAGLICLFGLSCRSLEPVRLPAPEGYPNHSAREIIGHLPTSDSLWSTFEIKASLAFSTPQESGSFSADILVRMPDSVLLRVKAPLGIEVARALITRDSLLLYDRVRKTLYTADVNKGLLPAGLRSGDLAAAFFGFDRPAGGEWSVTADSTVYRLARRDSTEFLVVDPTVWRMTARDRFDAEGTVIERRRFTEFEVFGGLVLPRRIVTIRPGDDTRASFFVRRVEPEPPDADFDLGLRENTRRVEIH